MTTTQTLEDIVRTIFAATDAKDAATIEPLVTDDVRMQFGSAEPTVGKQVFLAGAEAFYQTIGSLRHEITSVWQPTPEVVVTEMLVHYVRLDGQALTLPCVNVFYFRGEKCCDYRIYMDINPVYAPAAT